MCISYTHHQVNILITVFFIEMNIFAAVTFSPIPKPTTERAPDALPKPTTTEPAPDELPISPLQRSTDTPPINTKRSAREYLKCLISEYYFKFPLLY